MTHYSHNSNVASGGRLPKKNRSAGVALLVCLFVLSLVSVWTVNMFQSATSYQSALRNTIDLAQCAEALGYSRYWIAEHHATPSLASPAPEVLLARVGAETSRIRIGSGAVLLPLGGLSKYEAAGGPFVDHEADAALFAAIRETVRPDIAVHEVAANINDVEFADATADTFLQLWSATK
jgi:hypothetical protein